MTIRTIQDSNFVHTWRTNFLVWTLFACYGFPSSSHAKQSSISSIPTTVETTMTQSCFPSHTREWPNPSMVISPPDTRSWFLRVNTYLQGLFQFSQGIPGKNFRVTTVSAQVIESTQSIQGSRSSQEKDRFFPSCRIDDVDERKNKNEMERERIQDFLQQTYPQEYTAQSTTQVEDSILSKFHIHGWRWHTLSLARDLHRLETLIQGRLSSFDTKEDDSEKEDMNHSTITNERLIKAAQYALDFNWKGLQRIESKVFFPWLRQQLLSPPTKMNGKINFEWKRMWKRMNEMNGEDNQVELFQQAFRIVLEDMEEDRNRLSQQATYMLEQVKTLPVAASTTPSKEKSAKDSTFHSPDSKHHYKERLMTLARLSKDLYTQVITSINVQDTLIVPAVALLVSENDQKSLNGQVLRSLGLFESRLHLVGMYEAVCEQAARKEPSANGLPMRDERKLFDQVIPSIPRLMLPRWKRTLYEPQAGVLNETW